MNVEKLKDHLKINGGQIRKSILDRSYKPSPVKWVYIPKSNGKKRPLGIPCATDRVIQQSIAQKLSDIYEPKFSNSSYGFRPNRSAHMAIEQVLEYLNEGYEWVIDLDIEKFFNTVNHDKLIQVLRLEVNDSTIIRNLTRLNRVFKNGFDEESIYKVAHSSYGLYKRASMDVCNFILSPKVLEIPNQKENRPGLINPLAYYLKST